MFKAKFNDKKFKTNVRLCINRLKLVEKKKTEMALKARKEIADYIKISKTGILAIKSNARQKYIELSIGIHNDFLWIEPAAILYLFGTCKTTLDWWHFIIISLDRARIRVEHIIREDYLVEGLEIAEMFLDLLLARVGLINLSNEIDPGMAEAISSVIWVQPRIITECPELKIVCDELGKKYGKGRVQQIH